MASFSTFVESVLFHRTLYMRTNTDHGWVAGEYFGPNDSFTRVSTVTAGSEDGRDFPCFDRCKSTPAAFTVVSCKVEKEKARTPRGIKLTTGNSNHNRAVRRAILKREMPYPVVAIHFDPTGFSSKQKSRPNRPPGWYAYVKDIAPEVRECGDFLPANLADGSPNPEAGAAVWTWAIRPNCTTAARDTYPPHHKLAGEPCPVGSAFYACLRMNVPGERFVFFPGDDAKSPPAAMRAYVLAVLGDMNASIPR